MIARVLLGLGLLLSVTDAHALWDRYSPFEPGEITRSFPLVELASVSHPLGDAGQADCYELSQQTDKTSKLRIEWAVDDTVRMTLTRNGAKEFSGPIKTEGSPAGGLRAYTADLNTDSRPDYVMFIYSCGCGLAAQMSWVVCLLSSPSGYVSTCVLSYDAVPTDFIAINDRPYLAHTSFVYGPVGKDGRQHNYWVYNLLTFSGTELVLANERDVRFLEWVLYSFAENHRDTDQLTFAQRRLSLKQILEVD